MHFKEISYHSSLHLGNKQTLAPSRKSLAGNQLIKLFLSVTGIITRNLKKKEKTAFLTLSSVSLVPKILQRIMLIDLMLDNKAFSLFFPPFFEKKTKKKRKNIECLE